MDATAQTLMFCPFCTWRRCNLECVLLCNISMRNESVHMLWKQSLTHRAHFSAPSTSIKYCSSIWSKLWIYIFGSWRGQRTKRCDQTTVEKFNSENVRPQRNAICYDHIWRGQLFLSRVGRQMHCGNTGIVNQVPARGRILALRERAR